MISDTQLFSYNVCKRCFINSEINKPYVIYKEYLTTVEYRLVFKFDTLRQSTFGMYLPCQHNGLALNIGSVWIALPFGVSYMFSSIL